MKVTLVLALVTTTALPAVAAPVAVENTRKLLSVFEQGAEGHQWAEVEALFDYDALVMGPMAPHRSKLNAEQFKRYDRIFREVLKDADRWQGGNEGLNYVISKTVVKGHAVKVEVVAYDEETDSETVLTWHWHQKNDLWRVVDVAIDGESLVKSYQNQFGRLISKEGPERFLNRLEEKLKRRQKLAAG